MTDSSLSEEAKTLLENLANALPGIKTQDDGKGNLKYEHKAVSPFVKPILRTAGLTVWLAMSFGCAISNERLQDWKFTVWKWHTSFMWEDLPGSVYIIPVCSISESARSEPGGVLKYGVMRRIDGKVNVEPTFAAIFAVPPPAWYEPSCLEIHRC